jgi:hypothetical protein
MASASCAAARARQAKCNNFSWLQQDPAEAFQGESKISQRFDLSAGFKRLSVQVQRIAPSRRCERLFEGRTQAALLFCGLLSPVGAAFLVPALQRADDCTPELQV